MVRHNATGRRTPTLTYVKYGVRSPSEEARALMVLAEDHYIEPRKTAEGATYAFRWPLVQKWWKEMRS